jgi:hypothetical protein
MQIATAGLAADLKPDIRIVVITSGRRSPQKMKRATMIFSAVALTFAMAGPVLAQMPMGPAAANADTSFFDSHPDITRKLQKIRR